jgi:hypothetical protein
VFVEVLSEFLYLFLCHLMFFVFGVLKFLECILYILVGMSNIFSMNFSEISSKISSLRVFLKASMSSLVTLRVGGGNDY